MFGDLNRFGFVPNSYLYVVGEISKAEPCSRIWSGEDFFLHSSQTVEKAAEKVATGSGEKKKLLFYCSYSGRKL